MKVFRLAALVAVPAALLLNACSGGSNAIGGGGGGVIGQQANVRFVNAMPGTTSFDIYFQSQGSASPNSPLLSSLAYGIASDFKPLPTVAGNVIVQTAGSGAPSTGTPQLASCPVPTFVTNTNYSIVVATANGAINCLIYADTNYTGSANQYRFHDASTNANAAIGTTVAHGVGTAPGIPGTTTFAVLGTQQLGTAAVGGNGGATYTVVGPTTMGTLSNVTFAVGPSTGGATAIATTTLDAGALTLPGSTTEPNTASNNFTLPAGFAGASIYAIDCGTGTLPAGTHCTGGVALIGVFDSH